MPFRFALGQLHRSVKNPSNARNSGHPFSLQMAVEQSEKGQSQEACPPCKARLRLEYLREGHHDVDPNAPYPPLGATFEDCTFDLKVEPTRRCAFEALRPAPSSSSSSSTASPSDFDSSSGPPDSEILAKSVMATRNKPVLHADKVALILTDAPKNPGFVRVYMKRKDRKEEGWYRFTLHHHQQDDRSGGQRIASGASELFFFGRKDRAPTTSSYPGEDVTAEGGESPKTKRRTRTQSKRGGASGGGKRAAKGARRRGRKSGRTESPDSVVYADQYADHGGHNQGSHDDHEYEGAPADTNARARAVKREGGWGGASDYDGTEDVDESDVWDSKGCDEGSAGSSGDGGGFARREETPPFLFFPRGHEGTAGRRDGFGEGCGGTYREHGISMAMEGHIQGRGTSFPRAPAHSSSAPLSSPPPPPASFTSFSSTTSATAQYPYSYPHGASRNQGSAAIAVSSLEGIEQHGGGGGGRRPYFDMYNIDLGHHHHYHDSHHEPVGGQPNSNAYYTELEAGGDESGGAQQWQQHQQPCQPTHMQLTEQALLATFGVGVAAAGVGMGATSAAMERVAVSHARSGSNGSDESAPESSVTAVVKQAEADLTKALQVPAAQVTRSAPPLPVNVLNQTVDDDIYDLFTDGS